MTFGVMEIVLIVVMLVVTYRLASRGRRRNYYDDGQRPAPGTEAELLRDIHQGLARMEKRIEALETLLMDRDESRRASAGQKRP